MQGKVSRAELLIGFLAVLSILLVLIGNSMLQIGMSPVGVYLGDLLICGAFAVDYVQRLRASEFKRRFVKSCWYEPLAMIPAIALDLTVGLPIFAIGLRALRLVRVVRIVVMFARLRRTFSVAEWIIERSHLISLAVLTAGIVVVAAVAVLASEFRFDASPIKGFSDALWWSLATVTTVGYGDIVPATPLGRGIGMLLMVVGISVMAALISEVSAALVESRLRRAGRNRRTKSTIKADDVSGLQETVGRVGELTDAQLTGLLHELIEAHRAGRVRRGEGAE